MFSFRAWRFAAFLLLVVSIAGCKEEGSGVEVKALTFTGNKAVSTKQLKSVLATLPSAKLPWGDKQFFDRKQFEADLKRIVAFYRDRGFPDARVRSFDVELSPDQKSVRLRVDIDEGEPLRAERVLLEGFDPLPENHRRDLEARLPLKSGRPLDRALLLASREAAIDELKDHGFPAPKVDVNEEPGSSERQRIIKLVATPGRLAYVGSIEVAGSTSVNPRVILRQLTFKPGELFQQSKLIESQRKLYSLELFNFVNAEALSPPGPGVTNGDGQDQAEHIATRVTVTEGKHRKVNLGFGYGSEEHTRGEIDWRHVNFFGGARTAGVFARYSDLDRGVRLNFRQPYVFSPRYSLGISGQSWFSNEPAFELTTIGGRVTLAREFGRAGTPVLGPKQATLLAVSYTNEWEDYTVSSEALADPSFRDDLIALGLDPETGRGRGQLSAFMFDLGRNTTGNLLDAKRGYVAQAHLELAGGFLGGAFDYRELTGEGRYYVPIGNRAVVAVRARAGSIDSPGPEEQFVPFFKRYFLGGSSNLRGWGRYEVAPLTENGEPVGGFGFMNFSTELRVPIKGSFGAVLFLDGGNVWSKPWDINLNDMRYDVGPGIRFDTRIGPIRFDVGYQLNPIPGLITNSGEKQTRQFRVHFSIGQAF